MIFLGVQVTGTEIIHVSLGARNNRKLMCIGLNYVKSGNLNSQKDPKDKAFSMQNITFRAKMY